MFEMTKIKHKEFTDSEEATLKILALREKTTYYELWKKDKVAKSNTTVLNALDSLVYNNFIEFDFEGEQPKRGRGRKFYRLNLFGLVVSLTLDSVWQRLDDVAVVHKDKLPLILGLWDFWKEHDLKDCIMSRLHESVQFNAISGKNFMLRPSAVLSTIDRDSKKLYELVTEYRKDHLDASGDPLEGSYEKIKASQNQILTASLEILRGRVNDDVLFPAQMIESEIDAQVKLFKASIKNDGLRYYFRAKLKERKRQLREALKTVYAFQKYLNGDTENSFLGLKGIEMNTRSIATLSAVLIKQKRDSLSSNELQLSVEKGQARDKAARAVGLSPITYYYAKQSLKKELRSLVRAQHLLQLRQSG